MEPNVQLTLADHRDAGQRHLAETQVNEQREYDLILGRAAGATTIDANRLDELAKKLGIDPVIHNRNIDHAVADHKHRLALYSSRKAAEDANAEARRTKEEQAAETERHQRKLAALEAEVADKAKQAGELESLCRGHALELATPVDDRDLLDRRVKAGEIAFYVLMNLNATGPEYHETVGNWLREYGWRNLPNGWSDPLVPESHSPMNMARNIQLSRDFPESFRRELRRQTAQKSASITAVAARAPSEAAAKALAVA